MSKCGPQTNSITWEIWGNANIWTPPQPIESESLGVGLGVSGSYAFYWLGSTEFNWAWIRHGGHQPRWWQWGLLLDCTGACGKEPAWQCRRLKRREMHGSIPVSGRSPGEGNGNPHQYSCLEYPIGRGAWQATVYRVTKSWTRLKQLSTGTSKYASQDFLSNRWCSLRSPLLEVPFLEFLAAILGILMVNMALILRQCNINFIWVTLKSLILSSIWQQISLDTA